MRMSNLFYLSQKEVSEKQESQSYQFMIKSGLIRKTASGIYTFLPLGQKILENIENVIKEQLENYDMNRIETPNLAQQEQIEEECYKIRDRNGKVLVLNSEKRSLYMDLVNSEINSYKKLPVRIYHIQKEYRDEEKVRYGLIRSKEMICQQGYCFDTTKENSQNSYESLKKAYQNILKKCKIPFVELENEEKTIAEYVVSTDNSDNFNLKCTKCGYQQNLEQAKGKYSNIPKDPKQPIEKIYTPHIGTVEDLEKNYHIPGHKIVKTILYKADDQVVIGMVKGNRDINEKKFAKILGVNKLELADEETVLEITGAILGFAGPIDLKKEIPIYVDEEVVDMSDFLVGANESDYHYIHVDTSDFTYERIVDIRMANSGDTCINCKEGVLELEKVIKIGKIEKLDSKIAEQRQCFYIDETGKNTPMEIIECKMGITRLMAAIAEKNQDEKGILWPKEIAPFEVSIIPISMEKEEQKKLALEIEEKLQKENLKNLFDDRKERPGAKFADAELIGIPYRITIGRDAEDRKVEFCNRMTGEVNTIKVEEIYQKIKGEK